MLIYLLLVLILLICAISYILVDKDFFAPPVVFSGVFIFAMLVAIPNLTLWNFDMGERTFMVLLLGIYSFCIGYFIMFYCRKYLNKKMQPTNFFNSTLYIKNYKLVIIFFIQIVTVYLFYQDMSNIAARMGGGDTLAEKMFLYRTNIVLNNNEYGDISSLTSNLLLICQIFTYFFMYKFCDIYFSLKKINKTFLTLIIINLLIGILKGARGPAVDYLVSFSIMMYIFWLMNSRWKKTLSLKNIMLVGTVLVIFLMLFSSIGLILVGREEQLGETSLFVDIWTQVSMYVGAPLKLLDLYMYTDYNTEKISWGMATFRNVYELLSRYSFVDFEIDNLFGLEFRSDNGQDLGNVYTAFRPFVMDFGYIGLVVLSLIEGMVYAYIFFSIKYYSKHNINYNIILYSFLFIALFRAFCLEEFYINIFNMNFIKMIIFYKIIEYAFFSKKHDIVK